MIASQWQLQTVGTAIAVRKDGTAAIATDKSELVLLSRDGKGHDTVTLKGPTVAGTALRVCDLRGEAWLVLRAGLTELVRVQGREQSAFGKGDDEVRDACTQGDFVAIARAESVELWTAAGQRRWRHEGDSFIGVTMVQKAVVGLREDGTCVFLSMMSGSASGDLKLEVPEHASTWKLATLEGSRFAMTLGEWLVIVDVAKEKVFRRTRLRSKAGAIATNERRIVVGLADGWVQAVEALTGEIRASASVHESAVRALAITGEGALSLATDDIRGWQLAALSGSPVAAAPITALASQAATIAVGDRAGKLRIQRGVEELASLRLEGAVAFVHIGADQTVLAASPSLLVRLASPWKVPKPLVLENACSAFCADEGYAFCGTNEGQVDVYDFSIHARLTRYELTEGPISALHRPRGGMLAVGTDALDGRIFLVDLVKSEVAHRIEAHQEAFGVTALASEPRGRVIASGSDDGTIALIDVSKGKVLGRVRVPETPVSLAFDPSGKRIAAALADGSVVLIALDQKGAVTKLETPKAARVAWGDALVVGLEEGRIELVRTTT
jgi:hypothetical protein